MKYLIYSLALLCLLGCASKPHNLGCIGADNSCLLFMDAPWTHSEGSIRHVTPEQWKAAQGLHHPHQFFIHVDGTWAQE
jgi:hypothetical protein